MVFCGYPQFSLAGERMFTYTYLIQVTHTSMSKHQVIRTLRQEIASINQDIDLRIIRGLSYRRQALRHRMLTAQLHRLTRRESVFGRMLGFAF